MMKARINILLLLLPCYLILSCSKKREYDSIQVYSSTKSADSVNAILESKKNNDEYLVTDKKIGNFRLCQSFNSFNLKNISSEMVCDVDVCWSLKKYNTNTGTYSLENSWVDTNHVWRISSNDQLLKTIHNIKINDPIIKIKTNEGFEIMFEGLESLSLKGKETGIFYGFSEEVSNEFYEKLDSLRDMNVNDLIEDDWKIKEFTITGNCR